MSMVVPVIATSSSSGASPQGQNRKLPTEANQYDIIVISGLTNLRSVQRQLRNIISSCVGRYASLSRVETIVHYIIASCVGVLTPGHSPLKPRAKYDIIEPALKRRVQAQ